MRNRAVRAALLIVFIAAMAATGYLFWKADRQALLASTAATAFDTAASDVQGKVADLRAAQQAYVAAGQGADFWLSRTTAVANDIKGQLASLKAQASVPATVAALDDAAGVLQDFEQMDGRAREFARNRQLLLASDLIFSDGLEITRKLGDAVGQARTSERIALDAERGAQQRRQLYSFGAAVAGATLIVLLLMPSGAREARAETVSPVPRTSSTLSIAPTPLSAGDVSLDLDSWAPPKPAAAGATATQTPPAGANVDLQAVATVCGELARLSDTRALPAVLERASQLLDAQGIILWIADPDGRELTPILAHGYPQNLVTRLGTIQRDADNATAAALRTGLVQTVNADTVSNGAIAAPLVTATGCVGVMAAEVRHEGERQNAIVATAGIIASQLATLVGPPSSRPKSVEAAG